MDREGVVVRQRVGDGHLQRPGVALVAVGTGEAQRGIDAVAGCGAGFHVPHLLVKAFNAAVQGVGPIVGCQRVVVTVEAEVSLRDAVGVTPDQCTEISPPSALLVS